MERIGTEHMAEGLEKTPLSPVAAVVRNPLSVIAMFVLLVEAIATITLVQVKGEQSIALPLVWFVVLFPTLIALLFFSTLWWRHYRLYSPMEYRSDESFLSAEHRLQRVEAKQEAAELNPRTTDEMQSRQVVERLLGLGDVRAAVRVGRTFLEAGQFDIAARIFRLILEKSPSLHEDRYNALANLGYAQIGLEQYEDAVDTLSDCISRIGERKAYPWHNLALAYAHYKLSSDPSDDHYRHFKSFLAKGKSHPWFNDNREFYKSLYRDIADQL
jgi:tetratricopeptide (TPR) repeat protein